MSSQASGAAQSRLLNGQPGAVEPVDEELLRLGPYKAQQPPAMTENEISECKPAALVRINSCQSRVDLFAGSKIVLGRVFGAVSSVDGTAREGALAKAGFPRLAKLNLSQKPRLVLLLRIMTRCLTGLDGSSVAVKNDGEDSSPSTQSSAANIRQTLLDYVLQDFRKRLELAISWLNEEYYNDLVQMKSGIDAHRNYPQWALKVLDGITTYLNAKDKILIRFLSEVPEVNEPMLDQVKNLARDPERVGLAVSAIA